MNIFRRTWAILGAGAVALSLGFAPATARPDAATDKPTAQTDSKASFVDLSAVGQEIEPHDVNVVIMLADQPDTLSEADESTRLAAQDALIARLSAEYGLTVERQFAYLVNGFSATVSSDKIIELSQEPEIESVKRERIYYPTEATARDMHAVAEAYANYGVDGTGTVVAIIDSGIDVTHQDMRLDDGVCEASKLAPDEANGFTCKVPRGYNYADDNWTVIDTTGGDHGMHVAGIVAANGADGSDAPDFDTTGRIDGAAPNAQLLAMKVFSNSGRTGASDGDIVAAIEDSVKLGADVMNLSLGSPNGLQNHSDGMARAINAARENGIIAVISAGNAGLNFSPTMETDDIFGKLDDGTLGAPSVQLSSFSVASMDNSHEVIPVAHWFNDDQSSDLPYSLSTGEPDGQKWEVVDVGFSKPEDYPDGTDLTGKYALAERGGNSFGEKFQHAFDHGAEGIILFDNSAAGEAFIGMAGVEQFDKFGASIYRSHGRAIRDALKAGHKVEVQFTDDQQVVAFADGTRGSSFSSWGPAPTLDFKPNIAGIGGSVYSTVNADSYATKSGTSMAAPNISGLSALVLEEYRERYPELSGRELADRIEIALQNTALIPRTPDGVPLSPRQIGAGLANVDNALETHVFATVDGAGEVPLYEVNGAASFTVTLTNTGAQAVTYTVPAGEVVNETNDQGEVTTTFVSGETLTPSASTVTVHPGETASVTFTLSPDTSHPHFITGWAQFKSDTAPDLSVPYMGFVGDWNAEPIILPEGQVWLQGVNNSRTQLVTRALDMVVPINALGRTGSDPDAEFWLSPNGDGDADVMVPNLVMLRNASDARYDVLDVNGNPVRTLGIEQDLSRQLAYNVILAGANADISHTPSYVFDGMTWDPADATYTAVPDGRYTYRVSVRMGENFDWQTYDFDFGVDNTAPVVEFESYDSATLVVKIVEEGSGLAAAPTFTDSSGAKLTHTDLGDQRYSVDIPAAATSVTASVLDRGFTLGVGTYLIDENTIAITSRDYLESEVIGPETAGVNNDSLRVQGFTSASISGLTVNGEPASVLSGRFSALVPLTQGANEITFVGTNAAGDVVDTQTITVTYDSTPPNLERTSLDNAGIAVIPEGGNITVTGTVTDERESAELTLTINGEPVSLADDGTFSYTFTPEPEALTFTVKASDGVNTVTQAVSIDGRLPDAPDWALPTFVNADCAGGLATCFIPSGSPDYADGVFTMRGEGAIGVAKVIFTPRPTVAGGHYVKHEPIAAVPDATGAFTADLPVAPGINSYNLKIVDQAGEVRLEQALRLFYDTEFPTITFDEPKLVGGTLYTNRPEVTFAGTASDDGWGYKLKINSSTIAEIFNLSGTGPQSNERTFSEVVQVADGDTIQIEFSDAYANNLIAHVPVILDSQSPTVDVSAADGGVIRDSAPVVSEASDPTLASINVSLVGAGGEVLNETVTAELATKQTSVESALVVVGDAGGEADAAGTLTESTQTALKHELDTTGLSGEYTLTATSTDLAGNVTAQAVTFTVNPDPVIEAPESVDLDVFLEQFADQAVLRDLILEHVTVTDDAPIAADPARAGDGETVVDFAPGTVLAPGENTVTIVATQADGVSVEHTVAVNVAIKDVTLSDDGVSITGPFRSDDALTTTISADGTTIQITNKEEFAAQTGVVTIPASEGTAVRLVLPSGERIAIDATWADGLLTFEGSSRSTFELAPKPAPVEPGGGGEPVDPGTGEPGTGEPGTGPSPTPEPATCEVMDRPANMPRATNRLGEATGDRSADLWSVDADGAVHFYAGSGDGRVHHSGVVMCDQEQITELTPIPDVNGDKRSDLLVRHTDGTIHYYYSDGAGFLTKGIQAGRGWNTMDNIVYAGNFGGTDLVVARHVETGQLFAYTLDRRGMTSRGQIGRGWNAMDVILAPGQFTGDSNPDLIAISKDGKMFGYKGLRNATFVGVGQVGHGWSAFGNVTIPGDVTGDGRLDMIAIRDDGKMFIYANTGRGSWAKPVLVGHGWGRMKVIS